MKIVFIHPHLSEMRAGDAMQPLGFGLLAAKTPPDIEIALFDDRIEAVDYDVEADLVALSVQTFTAKRSYRIADRFRDRGVPVVMGGCHPTLLPEESSNHADSVVTGDGEVVWLRLLEDAANNRLKTIYRSDNTVPLENLIPDRRIFRGKRYSKIAPVQFGRGCRYSCDFCSIHSLYGNTLRQRKSDEVIRELEGVDEKLIFFVDDNLFVNYHEILHLLEAATPLKKRWVGQVSVDSAWNDELLRTMEKSGCLAVFIGFESLDKRNLKQMKKRAGLTGGTYVEAIKRFQSHGIMVIGSFLFGYDYDTPDTIRRALDFSLEQKLCLAHFNPLFPTPGTPLYGRLAAEKRLIFDRWWLSDEYRYGDAMFYPVGMTCDELTEGCLQARIEFNKYSAYLRRAAEFKANSRSLYSFGVFLISNLISRREIFRKQGIPLG